MVSRGSPSKVLIALIAINTLIFLLLSCLHFYWGFGGKLWLADVLPSNTAGTRRMAPGVMTTFVVAFGLLILALITIGNLGTWDKYVNRKWFRYAALLTSIVFFIRAIGDFKFVGFFKTIKATTFAINDTRLFSPLCMVVSLIALLIFTSNKLKH